MTLFRAVLGAAWLLLALVPAVARAQSNSHTLHVDTLDSCHKGLVVWRPLPPVPKCGYVQLPQVKVFDNMGRLRFAGSALDAFKWAKSGMPDTRIPESVVVRDAASEARVTHVAAPTPGQGWVTYYVTQPCPPCATQLATFRTEVMPKLGAGTSLSVFELVD